MRFLCGYYKEYFICCNLIFLSQFLSGLIPLLIQGKEEIKGSDNFCKILLLLLFASYFNLIETIVRRKYFSKINDNLPKRDHFMEYRFKNIQIEISALLSYFLIRIKIYRHQLISLLTIFFYLLLIMIADIIDDHSDLLIRTKYFLLSAFTCIARSFLDTIEKYLFEFNFLRPHTILLYEGLIGTLFNPLLLLIDKDSHEDLKKIEGISNEKSKFIILIILFICFIIISSFKNIYRVLTVQYYSPMTRALAESILDPFVILYYFILFEEKEFEDYLYFCFIIYCLGITAFSSLVYNDFVVLYCCEMERNTYLEINNRLYDDLNDDILNDNDDNNNGKQRIELVSQY